MSNPYANMNVVELVNAIFDHYEARMDAAYKAEQEIVQRMRAMCSDAQCASLDKLARMGWRLSSVTACGTAEIMRGRGELGWVAEDGTYGRAN